MLVYDGVEYNHAYGTLIRSLDREQAAINEQKRIKFYKQREKQLWKHYEKVINKETVDIVKEKARAK